MWKTLLLAGAMAIGMAALSGAEAGSRPQSAQAAPIARAAPAHAGLIPVQQNLLSPRDVIDIVHGRFGGEPMGTPSLDQSGQRPVYSVRWRFPNEVVEVVRVDAVTGQVFR